MGKWISPNLSADFHSCTHYIRVFQEWKSDLPPKQESSTPLPSTKNLQWPLMCSSWNWTSYLIWLPSLSWNSHACSGPLFGPLALWTCHSVYLESSPHRDLRLLFFSLFRSHFHVWSNLPRLGFVPLLTVCFLPLECWPHEGKVLVAPVYFYSPSPAMPAMEGC